MYVQRLESFVTKIARTPRSKPARRTAKVADLPVEQVSMYRLWVNLKSAKALSIKIPESILVPADEVIK